MAAFAALVVAVALVALAMFGGGDGYKVTATFQNAGQLVEGNQVRIGGTVVGTIDRIDLNDSGQAEVEMRIEDDDLAPLHEGTTATVRATSLSGIANRYVSLQPGPNNRREIEDGGAIGADDTAAPVDFDQLFDTLDEDTRAGLRNVIRGSADWYDGRADEASESARYFNPFLVSTTELTRELALDQKLFERFVRDTANTMTAIAERRDDLAALVSNTNTAMAAIGDESVALQRALELLPPTLRKANTTFVNLRSTLDDLEVLVRVSKPATRELAPFLRELRPLVRDARPTIADLRKLIRAPGSGNDLIDLTAKQPKLARLTARAVPRTIRALDRSQPVIEYARSYMPDFAGWITKFGGVAGYYDANGHYARVMPVFSPSRLTASNTLEAVPPDQRLAAWQRGNLNRCPGGATQPAPDGSSPWPLGADQCNPSTTPPGP